MAQEYPGPLFHFLVEWGGARIGFTEVTGLAEGREAIEFRETGSKEFNKISMPGMFRNSNITLKRGKFEKDFDFKTWMDDVANKRGGKRCDVTIRLFNEKHEQIAAWKASQCFPVKITAPDLKSDGNEIAVESMELAHEGLKKII
jgi:phage tail-like protein